MTTPSKAALRAELEAALANYRGPVKQCPAAPPPELVFEEELAPLDDDETDEDVVPRAVIAARGQGTKGNKTRRRGGEARGPKRIGAIAWQAAMNDWSDEETDNPLYVDRNFYKVEKWTKDGTKIDHAMKSLAQVGLMALYIFSTSSQQSLRFSASEPKWID